MLKEMFDLTDDVENSPDTTRKAKPAEVIEPPPPDKDIAQQNPEKKKDQPKNDESNEYEYSDDKEIEDSQW